MDVFDLFAKLSLDTSAYEKGLSDAGKKTVTFKDKLGSGLKNAALAGAAAVTTTAAAITAIETSIVSASGKVAAYGDNIDKMSQKMGISAEAYQEWDAIMQHSGTTIEALKPSMKTLATQAEKGSDAFTKLGISQKEVAELSQEDLFARVITELQQMEEGSERTYITSQLLGRGATELGALLNTSAEDTEKMRKRVHELGGVMSNEAVKASAAYQDSLQDMQTAVDSISRNLASNFLPSITSVMDGITNIFSGEKDFGLDKIKTGVDSFISSMIENIPKAIEVGSEILGAIGEGIISNLPNILSSGVEIVTTLANSFIENLPTVVDAGLQIILGLATGLGDALPELIPTVVDVILQIVDTLIDNIDKLIDASIAIILGLANGLIKAIPKLLEKAPVIIQKLVTTLMDNAPKMVEAAIELITMLTNFLVDPQNMQMLIDAQLQIVGAVVSALIENAPMLIDAAIQIISALAAGLIMYVSTLTAKSKELVEEFAKSFDGMAILKSLHDIGWGIIDKVAKGIADTIMIAKDWGKDLIDNFISGIKEKGPKLDESVISYIAKPIKDLIGFSEPKKGPLSNFHTFSPDMISLFIKGIKDNENLLQSAVEDAFNFSSITTGFASSVGNIANAIQSIPSAAVTTATGGFTGILSNLTNVGSLITSPTYTKPSRQENQMITIELSIDGKQFGRIVTPLINAENERLGTSLAY